MVRWVLLNKAMNLVLSLIFAKNLSAVIFVKSSLSALPPFFLQNGLTTFALFPTVFTLFRIDSAKFFKFDKYFVFGQDECELSSWDSINVLLFCTVDAVSFSFFEKKKEKILKILLNLI